MIPQFDSLTNNAVLYVVGRLSWLAHSGTTLRIITEPFISRSLSDRIHLYAVSVVFWVMLFVSVGRATIGLDRPPGNKTKERRTEYGAF